ncbi:MAG: DUF3343 domain-containing protein [Candidatus Bathyarchaeota archaeon]|nr:DUF3343 domain-containing protein [Candidatus Termiticorpusculum sp.]
MNKYISTFYSHYGALTYYKMLKEKGIKAKLMPTPRKISSSCGTCVHYETDINIIDLEEHEIETTYLETEQELKRILKK